MYKYSLSKSFSACNDTQLNNPEIAALFSYTPNRNSPILMKMKSILPFQINLLQILNSIAHQEIINCFKMFNDALVLKFENFLR